MFLSRSVNAVRPISTAAPRIRGWLIVAAAVAAGLFAGYAAANASGPFAGLRPYVAPHLVGSAVARTPIDAGKLFPSPAPPQVIHQVVPIYYRPAAPAPKESGSGSSGESDDNKAPTTPTPRPSQSPRPSPQPSPSPSPGGGDN